MSERRDEKAVLNVESLRLSDVLKAREREDGIIPDVSRQAAPSTQQSPHSFLAHPPAKLSRVFPTRHVHSELGSGCLLPHCL